MSRPLREVATGARRGCGSGDRCGVNGAAYVGHRRKRIDCESSRRLSTKRRNVLELLSRRTRYYSGQNVIIRNRGDNNTIIVDQHSAIDRPPLAASIGLEATFSGSVTRAGNSQIVYDLAG